MADSAPAIIDLLRQVRQLLSASHSRGTLPAGGAEALRPIIDILNAWESREDIGELRTLLGLNLRRGRRRTQRTVNREYGIAFAAYTLLERGDPRPLQRIAAEVHVDEKTVRRCMDRWANVHAVVKAICQDLPPGARLDYSDMLTPTDRK